MEISPHYPGGNEIILSHETLLPFAQGWRHPSSEEVRELIKKANLTGSQVADLIGVTSRTIRRYIGGEKPIHYAEWRLLLIYTNLVTPQIISDVINK